MAQYDRHSIHYEIHTGNGNAVSQGFVPGRIRCTGDIRPVVRESLVPLPLQRCQAADQISTLDHTVILTNILVIDSMVITIANGTHRLLVWLYDQVCGIFVLSGALGTDHIIFLEDVCPLPAEDRMPIHTSQRVCQISLIATTIATVFRLAVYDIANNAECFVWLIHQRQIVATSTAPG